MKTRLIISCCIALLATAAQAGSTAEKSKPATESKAKKTASSQKSTSAETPAPKSVFTTPAKPDDGRDPFFPTSDRLFAVKTLPKVEAPTATLVLNGISGSPESPLAIINGHTLGRGEEALITTPAGRIPIRCLDIHGEIAVVEVNGLRRELHFRDR
jgi:hypothetical protein